MSNRQIMETALQVRQVIAPSEQHADETLGQIGLLLHTTCLASARLGLAPDASREIMRSIGTAVARQIEVREALLDAHAQAAAIYHKLDPETAAGDHGCPPQRFFADGETTLQPVAVAA